MEDYALPDHQCVMEFSNIISFSVIQDISVFSLKETASMEVMRLQSIVVSLQFYFDLKCLVNLL